MKRKWIYLTTAIIVAVLFCLMAWQFFFRQPEKFVPADLSALPPLEVGDWVLRMGTETDSLLIRQIGGGDYSHIGVIVAITPQIMVIHATTQEPLQTPSDGVLLTPLTYFVASDRASAYAVIRPQFLTASQKQQMVQSLKQKVGQPFVLREKSKPHLYCTTLLENEIRKVSPDFSPQWQLVDTPIFRGEYLFPKAFVDYPDTVVIVRQ